MVTSDAPGIPAFKKWLIAVRPWSLPIHVVPIWMGTAMAWVYADRFRADLFLAAWIGMMLIHFASNMISDVYDYRCGLDRDVTPTSGAVARGWLTDRAVLRGGLAALAAGALIGLWVAGRSTPKIFGLGLAGVLTVLSYTGLKRFALGDLAVFVMFGPLIGLGAWMTQTGVFSWLPLLWLTPFGLVVIAVLHANNWRDIARDRSAGIRTVANLLGDRGSAAWYAFNIFGPYLLMGLMMGIPRIRPGGLEPMPWTFGITALALPRAVGLWRCALRRHASPAPGTLAALDGATAAYMVPFGLLSTLALLLARWMR